MAKNATKNDVAENAAEAVEMIEANEAMNEETSEDVSEAQSEEQSAEASEAVETAEAIEEAVAVDGEVSEEDSEPLAITQDDVRLVEAILFASSTSVSNQMIAERFPQERVKLIPDILELLQEQYANRGVNLVQRENRWALRTATDLGDQLRLEKEQPKKFTRAAMETMAIIAYHQPVTRAEIENIRGVATSPGALDALMEAGWIKPGKRREVPGRPVTWLTSQTFLDHFGLEKLEDLPGMEDLKAAGLLDKRPAIEAMPTADLFDGEAAKEEYDPQEVTDEDLIGKQEAGEGDDMSENETNETVDLDDQDLSETVTSSGDEDEDFDDDYDDEGDDEDAGDSDDDADEEDDLEDTEIDEDSPDDEDDDFGDDDDDLDDDEDDEDEDFDDEDDEDDED